MLPTRDPLRNHIRNILADRIRKGDLSPKTRLGAFELARELRVSPTPVREAMTQLEQLGLVKAEPNRGFFVAPFQKTEVADVYPLISNLETFAIENGELDSASQERFAELRRLNDELRSSIFGADHAVELDRRWHRTLAAACGNELLLQILDSLKDRAERYEHAYMLERGPIPKSTQDHEQIVAALLAGDQRLASQLLARHWQRSLDFLMDWLPTDTPPEDEVA